MQFSAREDIEAPIEDVFRAVSDFDGWERAGLRRGAEISRTDSLSQPGLGMAWATKFTYHNRARKADIEMMSYDAPNGFSVTGSSNGLNIEFVVELVSLSRTRTRMNMLTELKPTTISARLMMQPMKLARTRLANRYRQRVADFAGMVEDGYK